MSLLLIGIGLLTRGIVHHLHGLDKSHWDYWICFLVDGVFDFKAKTSKQIPPLGPTTIRWNYRAPCLLELTRVCDVV